jgi:hypothetical protein
MCLKSYSIKQLLDEINSRCEDVGLGLLNSKSNKKIYKDLSENNNLQVGIALTYGYPNTTLHNGFKCRTCGEIKDHTKFSFYLSRVGEDGYLMRSNALCDVCSKHSDKKRKVILKDADNKGLIPEKPKEGSVCNGCKREWHGKWHRHHDDETHEFIDWLCGHCNMSLSEQRGVYKV